MSRARALTSTVLAFLFVALPAWAGGPVRQQSADTAESFLGIILHGALAAGLDRHRDPFGGVNWTNSLTFLGFDRAPAGAPPQEVVVLTLADLTHIIAPHGEAAGPNLGIAAATIVAPGIQAPVLDAKRIAKAHATHEDQAFLVLLGSGNAGRFTGYLGLVAALHVVPERHFLVVSELRGEPQPEGNPPTGFAAFMASAESAGVSLALGVLSEGVEIEDVEIHSEATDEPFSVGAKQFPALDGAAGGVVRVEMPKELIATVLAGNARIRVVTSRGALTGRLGRIGDLVEAQTRPPYCRATVPVVVRQGAQGPSRDDCSKVIAQAEAFDAASDNLCMQAQCAGNCRIPGTECQPQIPLLPDPADLVCWQIPTEDCEGGLGWRCFWSSPQWVQCGCACR